MASFVHHTTIDCSDAYALSTWWKAVLDYVDLPGDPNEPGHVECLILDPATGHQLLFIEVSEPKAVKNRIHFDLYPREGTRDAEISRLLGLGATIADERRKSDGTGWPCCRIPKATSSACCARRRSDSRPTVENTR